MGATYLNAKGFKVSSLGIDNPGSGKTLSAIENSVLKEGFPPPIQKPKIQNFIMSQASIFNTVQPQNGEVLVIRSENLSISEAGQQQLNPVQKILKQFLSQDLESYEKILLKNYTQEQLDNYKNQLREGNSTQSLEKQDQIILDSFKSLIVKTYEKEIYESFKHNKVVIFPTEINDNIEALHADKAPLVIEKTKLENLKY